MAKQKRYNGYLRKTFTFQGKRIYVYGKTSQELMENECKKRNELLHEEQELYNPTLNSYYEHFTDIRRHEVTECTLRAQGIQFNIISSVLLANTKPFGEMQIKEITRREIEMARETLLSQGKTPQNLNICFAHLNHVFQSAVMDETIDKNPCKALKRLKRDAAPITENRHRALSEEETKKFFAVAEERNSFYLNHFLMLIKSGLRIGELSALTRADVDNKNGFLCIHRTISRNEVGGYIIGDETKTESGNRNIPLTDELHRVLIRQESFNRTIFGLEFNGLIFKSSEGQMLKEYTINREIKRICSAAGIEPFTCHAFRNTFATRFIEQRPQDYKILSEILGHKDISITLNLYTHVMVENKVKAMNEIFIRTS